MLATPWEQRRSQYDFVIIGSGYGGSIAAARLAAAPLIPKPSVCILERGKEWQLEDFPEALPEVISSTVSKLNPLGLFELLNYPDISILKGSGLGGTSLINANVAIKPDREIFEQFGWPPSITFDELSPYYDRALSVLASAQHPRTLTEPKLAKFKALEVRAKELGISAESLHINVNFTIDGKNQYGVNQKPCIDCGNCACGCKVGAKNTLMMNYLPIAKNAGATILTQAEAKWIEKKPDSTWRVHGEHVNGVDDCSDFYIDAGEIIVAAGSLNSTEILFRSHAHGLSVSPALGTKFSGNGDFFGLAYNSDYETDFLGYTHNQKPAPGDSAAPGPNIVGLVRYTSGVPEDQRIAVEDFSFPSALNHVVKTLFGVIQGEKTVTGNEAAQQARLLKDLDPFARPHDPNGAMNHSMFYLLMAHDNARGVIQLQPSPTKPDGCISVSWDQAGQQPIFDRLNAEVRNHAKALRANFISNPTWHLLNLKHLLTAHPLGGCPMADDYTQGVVDPFGRVYAADGSLHLGLSVTDGSVIPSALGVNPLLTISALTERFIENKIAQFAS
jgi:cholesterol oxidase